MCMPRVKHDLTDEDDQDVNKDIAILNGIKEEANQYFRTWWQNKTTIDIKAYPDQMASFTALVTSLKEKDGLTLTGIAIRKYCFFRTVACCF